MSPGEARATRQALEQVLEREGLGWLTTTATAISARDSEHQRLTTLIDATLKALAAAPAEDGPGREHVDSLVGALRDLRGHAEQSRFERRAI